VQYGGMSIKLPGFRLGVVGGGQLGRMMAVEARRLGIRTIALDPAERPPALGIADVTLQGGLYDAAALQKLALQSDVVTYEIEHINTKALHELESGGCRLFPRPATLETIQDKLVQKRFLWERGLPVPEFAELPAAAIAAYQPKKYPFVQKARSGGYDGRGVAVIRSEAELPQMLKADSMVEEYVPLRKELAVLLARGANGRTAVYPVIEMVFDPKAQICSSVCAPARVPDDVAARSRELAIAAIEALDGVGIFAVELFWAEDGRILINEIAPRPHNSGHWTIEGAVTNQFEQHIRAVCGLPLGSAELLRPSVMVNLLGEPGSVGEPVILGAAEALAIPGLKIHWYQKENVSGLRKMGHFTVTAPSIDEALALAEKAQGLLSVTGSR
jgi:5-(carboxyamino)imidazole ribonucleotide synthase